jgi:hypothetical protein
MDIAFDTLASGSGGRADCNNDGALIFFSMLSDFSSGG